MLRRHGVVGKFVEFYGDGVGAVPLANRATIGNMSPEYGSTCAIFPIDEETVALPAADRPHRPSSSRWSRRTPRSRACGTTRRASRRTPSTLELDLGDGRAVARRAEATAGPGRARPTPSTASAGAGRYGRRRPDERRMPASTRRAPSRSRPATRRRVSRDNGAGSPAAVRAARRRRRPAQPTRRAVTLADGTQYEIDHGAVVIAAITSCTNTSNPSVMIGAALLAKKAVEQGPDQQALGQDHARARAPRWSWTTTSAPG